ncbi:MAG: sulfite oxidase [Planctomycetes bacterium]|nr:sulfite oxidase [Planctomycetota bacterium]
MNQRRERGIHELYAEDPIAADRALWGRRSDQTTRRGFLRGSGLAALASVLGAPMVFADRFPAGLIPAALTQSKTKFRLPGKHDGLTVLNDRPINAETPAHLLDDEVTPADRLFVRNNGHPPPVEKIDPQTWTLEISGESCVRPTTFKLPELKQKFTQYTYQIQIECGGNGRREFNPPARGNQWSVGAVGCPRWTGVRLRDVLDHCGVRENAVYIGYYGGDQHLTGNEAKIAISRGVPIRKAREDESLIAWSVNGGDLPWLNGYPLRLVTGGWPASTCGKWLRKLVIRDRVHDGAKMTGQSYRVPKYPVAPGTKVPDEDMVIIESMPVRSLVTYPKSGIEHPRGTKLAIRGHAWAGDLSVKETHVSVDFGATWTQAKLQPPVNRLAWQHWSAEVDFPKKGYYEVWARAMDDNGVSQPMILPGWNPRGYLNNACHRIAVQAV